MSDRDREANRFTKQTLVRDAIDSVGADPVVVLETAALVEVAARAGEHPAVRVICVTDVPGSLTGVIRVSALCNDLFLSVAPEEFIAEILLPGRIEEFGRLSRSKTAGQLMEPPISVHVSDNLAMAFKRLREKGLEGIPVLDENRQPVAYLDSLRLIAVWLKTHSTGA